MKYLFVSGSPRSGTSALTELLSSHPDISLGMERFKFLYKKNQVKKKLFSKDEFFNFKDEQTTINASNGKYLDYYKQLSDKYTGSSIVGDKYPQLYKFWPSLFDEFGAEGKYIFIIRNIEDVASSFNLRAQNPRDKWPEKNDYRKAVEIWNESLMRAIKAKEAGADIFVVSYEKLFDSSLHDTKNILSNMISYLGMDLNGSILTCHKKMCSDYLNIIKSKAKTVHEGQMVYINEHADFQLLKKLLGS